MTPGFDLGAHVATKLDQQGAKLDVHEKRIGDLEKNQAVANERQLGMQASLSKIDNNTTWLVRLIIGSMILALLAFMYKGGLGG